jgi:nicotinate dehydrogenase subunit A
MNKPALPAALDHIPVSGFGVFVRIRTILRADPKAVKRPIWRKRTVPNKNSDCLPALFIKRAARCSAARPGLHVCIQTVVFEADFAGSRGNASTMRLTVNGKTHDVEAAPDTALLYVLRNDLELNGPKYGCGLGECGACAVLIDGIAARSCVIPISGCLERDIVTLEGLGSRDHPDPVQAAFIAEQAAQCGYCLNGMIMSTKALLLRNPHPSETELLEALRYNLCRCGAHIEIMRAAMRAAGALVEAQD